MYVRFRGEIYQHRQDRVCVPMPGEGHRRPRSARLLSERVLTIVVLLALAEPHNFPLQQPGPSVTTLR